MNRTKSNSVFISVVLIVALALSFGAVEVDFYGSYNTVALSAQGAMCKPAAQITMTKDKSADVNRQRESPNSASGTAATSSCNTSLQMVPVPEQQLKAPATSFHIIPPFRPSIGTQAFIFQEPDPPQLG